MALRPPPERFPRTSRKPALATATTRSPWLNGPFWQLREWLFENLCLFMAGQFTEYLAESDQL